MASHRQVLIPLTSSAVNVEQERGFINPLLLLALATDILTPFLIWKGIVPAELRWVSHASLALVMLGAVVRVLVFNRFPLAIWVIGWISVMGIGIATLRGQGPLPTLWGWWMMFQYPLVGLFVSLQPRRPANFSRRFYLVLLAILGSQVIVQIGQYLMGESPGDHLAGTFGRNGTGNLVIFIIIVFCVALGQWLTRRQWIPLLVVAALGSISSVLGEMKLFWVAVAAIGCLAMTIYVLQRGSFHRLVLLGAFLAAVLIVFTTWYNAVVPTANRTPLQKYLENPKQLAAYLNYVYRYEEEGSYIYDIGRNVALRYAWTALSDEPISLLFGLGLGARGQSDTLGATGIALPTTGFRIYVIDTGLLVMMQEMGLVGMSILVGFIIVTTATLAREIRRDPGSDATGLRYALILFTLLWPLWLWYNHAWTLRAPMLVYWVMMGHTMTEARSHSLQSFASTQTQVSNQP